LTEINSRSPHRPILAAKENAMFKHILVPTDGSKLALKGVKSGMRLARALGARVTGLYVVPPYLPPMYGEGAMYAPGLSEREYKRNGVRAARHAFEAVIREARAAGVPFVTKTLYSAPAWEGILRAARSGKCDAVVIASHGRGGLGGLLLGSETQRVLARSKIPVLVVR
jgi:nucleotide-binding universal stress UspA family protein